MLLKSPRGIHKPPFMNIIEFSRSGSVKNILIKLKNSRHFFIRRAMCSPSQGPCCTQECTLKYGDKCRDDNGCRDPSYCDGRMPLCPPSVNKANKTICNKEFVCFMGVSRRRITSIFKCFQQFFHPFFRRNVQGQFASRTASNRANAFPDQASQKRNRASFVAKFLVKIIRAKARSIGTRRLMMFPTCTQSPERLVTTTLDTVMFSRSVEKLIRPDLWLHSENFCYQKKALRHSRNGSSAIGMQSVWSSLPFLHCWWVLN